MRYALVRFWATLAIALLAGVIGDAGTEYLGALGWLGRGLRDVDHQSVLPTFTIAFVLTLALIAYLIAARISPSDPLLRRLDDARARAVDAFAALCGSALTVIGMEGYETHFGGLAPFDARSVVVAHAPVLLVAFVVVAVVARVLLGSAIRAAVRASAAAFELLSSFLRVVHHQLHAPKHSTLPHPNASNSHVSPEIVRAHGLRAPPRVLPALYPTY
jgi:hypothetical protein